MTMEEHPPASLSAEELAQLVARVFQPGPEDHRLSVLVDLPDAATPDTEAWCTRRHMAASWATELSRTREVLGLEIVEFIVYRNPRVNNAELPPTAWRIAPDELPETADALSEADAISFEEILGATDILLAPTQFSATAPLKILARRFPIRGATMPGFSAAMIPALRLDYARINQRVSRMKALCDLADSAELAFHVSGGASYALTLDLRFREGHASGGLFPSPGQIGNLPSGEAYIVPYEGELPGEPSRSVGNLPVQLGDEVLVYRIEANRAVSVAAVDATQSAVELAAREGEAIVREPAYANLAELGLGVLGDFGLAPTGEILLDEKLGLHIAFGRSDHFGGAVGPLDFSCPEAVIHIDRVYVPALQPRVEVLCLDLCGEGLGTGRLPVMRDGVFVLDFEG